jgi:hypothetical protein
VKQFVSFVQKVKAFSTRKDKSPCFFASMGRKVLIFGQIVDFIAQN